MYIMSFTNEYNYMTLNCLKITKTKKYVNKLHLQQPPLALPDPIHSDELFSTVSLDTPAEVSQLLISLQPKSSNLDFTPTSLIKACSSTFSSLFAHLQSTSSSIKVFFHLTTKSLRSLPSSRNQN